VETTVNCAQECINGCILGDKCPNLAYATQASKFIQETSLDAMLAIAEAARIKKLTQPTKWILPNEI
jgi:hypothetical protein